MKKNQGILIAIAILLLIVWQGTKTPGTSGAASTPEQKKRIAQKVKSLWWKLITYYAALYKVPAKRVAAIVAQESGGELNAKGSANDIGLMQITPIAIKDVDDTLKLNKTILDIQSKQGTSIYDFLFGNTFAKTQINYFDSKVNLQYGTAFLSMLYDRTGSIDEATRRYNGSGPAADEYLKSVKEFETYF